MKRFLIFILLLTGSISLFSQENSSFSFFDNERTYYDKTKREINASWKFMIPPPNVNSFGFVDISVGIGYEIIQGVYYIGVAGDMGIGFDWFALFSDDDDNKNNDKQYSQLGFSIGGRVYNLLQINNFRIWSFVGCDLLFIILPMPYVGAELAYKFFGLEYAYYFPINSGNPTRHQISIKFHLLNG